jgi:hypothetical protein
MNESKCRCFSIVKPYYNFILVIMASISYYFLHLSSTNNKCTHPCYFPLVLKHAGSEAGEEMEFIDEEF